jgi:hypothetical protein
MGEENKYKEAIPDALWTLLAILLAYIAPILLFSVYVFNGPVSGSKEIWQVLKIGVVVLGSASLFVGIPLFASSIVWFLAKIKALAKPSKKNVETLEFDAQVHGFILLILLPLILFFMPYTIDIVNTTALVSVAIGATAFSAVLAVPGYKEYMEMLENLRKEPEDL